MDSYVIHVYRRTPNDPQGIVGTVEVAGIGKARAFRSLDEVCEILMTPPGRRGRRLTGAQERHRTGG